MIFAVALVCGVVAGAIADSRGRSGAGYGLLGFFLGPIGVPIAAVLPPDAAVVEARQLSSGTTARCPACRETIRAEARVCWHCQHQRTDQESAEAQTAALSMTIDARTAKRREWRQVLLLLGLLAVLLLILWLVAIPR